MVIVKSLEAIQVTGKTKMIITKATTIGTITIMMGQFVGGIGIGTTIIAITTITIITTTTIITGETTITATTTITIIETTETTKITIMIGDKINNKIINNKDEVEDVNLARDRTITIITINSITLIGATIGTIIIVMKKRITITITTTTIEIMGTTTSIETTTTTTIIMVALTETTLTTTTTTETLTITITTTIITTTTNIQTNNNTNIKTSANQAHPIPK